ncbi:aspartate--tRNA ligase [bacterium]|nr:aspartate--tRNA ligase [bacterium]
MQRTKTIDIVGKVDQTVQLYGWVNVRRNMGKIAFLDLRDRWGIIQVVAVPQELDKDSEAILKDIRPEFVLSIEGIVQARGAKQINKDLPTGTVEILAKKIRILSEAETPPFEIENEDRQANEELRLKYRYLDLRHQRMKDNIITRDKVIGFFRDWLHKNDFVEVQTPILSKSTPEGARDYLVPSRMHPGKFFALPQAPQQYKQLLMVAGLDRYFQVAPCFRDEDARSDRSPGEFYQLDMEMSFMSQDEILDLTEKMFTEMVEKLFPAKKIMKKPWPRLDYDQVMKKYGTDKPDLRKDKNNPNELAFVWVVNFPLFAKQTEEDKFYGAGDVWGPSHNMFTMPKEEDLELLDKDPGKVRSYQHDLVLNGFEVGGGAVRISDMKIQEKVWDLIGFTDQQKKEFEHYFEAFKYGVPPHGGIAPGLDRLLMVLLGEKNLKEVTAFPLTSDGQDPMMESPSEVSPEQLDELGLQLKKK